jgi:hypothetical protein
MEPAAAMIVPLVLALCTAMASAAVVEHTFNVNFSHQELLLFDRLTEFPYMALYIDATCS